MVKESQERTEMLWVSAAVARYPPILDRSYRSALPLLPGQFLTDQTGHHRETCGTSQVENRASDSFAHDQSLTTRNPKCASTWSRR